MSDIMENTPLLSLSLQLTGGVTLQFRENGGGDSTKIVVSGLCRNGKPLQHYMDVRVPITKLVETFKRV